MGGGYAVCVAMIEGVVCLFDVKQMVFPFFPRGNLVSVIQDLYDRNILHMEERRILTIFIKVCYGVYELHRHNPSWAHRDIKVERECPLDFE